MITGFHSIIFSEDAEVTRGFFRDVLGWPHIDAGDGSVPAAGSMMLYQPRHALAYELDDPQ